MSHGLRMEYQDVAWFAHGISRCCKVCAWNGKMLHGLRMEWQDVAWFAHGMSRCHMVSISAFEHSYLRMANEL